MDKKGAASLPFIGAMNDSVDFMRKLWGASGLPGLPTAGGITQFAQGLPQALPSMITPTLDVDELDKRIADLRAVEQWLALNANMLRTTIQSLEVQRNTIATLKNFGGQMLTSMGVGAERSAPPPAINPFLRPKVEDRPRPALAPMPIPSPTPAAAAPHRPARARPKKKPATTAAAGMPLNPALWWGALHDQFTKVATAAAAAGEASPSAPTAAKPKAGGTATKRARKTARAKPAGG